MSRHTFSALYDQYPGVVAQMDETFTTHEFMLDLAHQHEDLYVEALCACRDGENTGESPPPSRTYT